MREILIKVSSLQVVHTLDEERVTMKGTWNVTGGVTVGDEETWYEQRFLLFHSLTLEASYCYVVQGFLEPSLTWSKLASFSYIPGWAQDGSGYNKHSPLDRIAVYLLTSRETAMLSTLHIPMHYGEVVMGSWTKEFFIF